METIFRKVSVKERLPEKHGTYITGDDEGYVTQNELTLHDNKLEFDDEGATWWLEEIELPIDELWDKYSERIDTDIDSLQFFAGKDVMTKEKYNKGIMDLFQ